MTVGATSTQITRLSIDSILRLGSLTVDIHPNGTVDISVFGEGHLPAKDALGFFRDVLAVVEARIE